MAIFTTRGLKIRLDNRYCFALMRRLYPTISAFKILKTAEGFELIKDIYILFAIIISTFLACSYWTFGIIIVCFSVLESVVEQFTWRGAFIKKYNLWLNAAILFSYIDGFFIYTTLVCLIVYLKFNWYGIVTYFSAKIIAAIFDWLISLIESAIRHKQNLLHLQTLGTTLTKSERNFLNSYLFYSKEKEIPLKLDSHELDEQNWKMIYADLQKKWPVIAGRITWDK